MVCCTAYPYVTKSYRIRSCTLDAVQVAKPATRLATLRSTVTLWLSGRWSWFYGQDTAYVLNASVQHAAFRIHILYRTNVPCESKSHIGHFWIFLRVNLRQVKGWHFATPLPLFGWTSLLENCWLARQELLEVQPLRSQKPYDILILNIWTSRVALGRWSSASAHWRCWEHPRWIPTLPSS